jgi:hypothetical protein
VRKNDCDTFYDVWKHSTGIMGWWFRIAVVYHTIMMLFFLVAVCIVVSHLMASSPSAHPAPAHHGTEFAGTLAAGAG